MKELIDNCTQEWTTYRSVKGTLFTNKKNGKSIFLLASGHRSYPEIYYVGVSGYIWSATPKYVSVAYYLYFGVGRPFCGWVDLFLGHCIRPRYKLTYKRMHICFHGIESLGIILFIATCLRW